LSRAERRLRAGWRLLLQVLFQIALTLALGTVLILIPGGIFVLLPEPDTGMALVIAQLAQLVTVTLSVFLARRLLDRRSFVSLGLQRSGRAALDVLTGIGITFVMMGFIFAAEWALGWLDVQGFAWYQESIADVAAGVLVSLIIFLLVGWNEELMSRGYHLQTIASGLTLIWGWIVSSAIFGLLHLANPNASWMAAAGIFLAGLLLGYGYIRTGQLWLSIGLHIGWNFFEGTVFGFPVSGLSVYTVIRTSVTGPETWTGGAFGPEAGLILLPALALGFGLIHMYARQRSAR
jgi:membrane protease YdiL (CAAX protease family)